MPKTYERICPTCSAPFTSFRVNAKYCSVDCRQLSPTRHQAVPKEHRLKPGSECRRCSTELPVGCKVYCSNECRIQHYSETEKNARRKRLRTKKCKECGTEFQSFNSTAKFCCKKCCKKDGHRREHAKIKALKDKYDALPNCTICGVSLWRRGMKSCEKCRPEFCKMQARKKNKRTPSKLVCKACGKEFYGRANQRYCHRDCKQKIKRESYILVCQNPSCGITFQSNRYRRACTPRCNRRVAYLKDHAANKRRAREYYSQNKEKCKAVSREAARQLGKSNREYVRNLKMGAACLDCGTICEIPATFHYDHVRGEKIANISSMSKYSRKVLEDEIAKCDLVCGNCHAKRTHERQKKVNAQKKREEQDATGTGSPEKSLLFSLDQQKHLQIVHDERKVVP